MDLLDEKLKTIDAGLVLDIGMGVGGFADLMNKNFKNYDEIVGIDFSAKNLKAAGEHLKKGRFAFSAMDGSLLGFADDTFDTVSISFTLHHLTDVAGVISEIKRVVKPGGTVIVCEMYHDKSAERVNSYHHMHHWYADVDKINGVPHNHTFTREALLKIINDLELTELEILDKPASADTPRDNETISAITGRCDELLRKIEGKEEFRELYDRGQEIKAIYTEKGIFPDPVLCAVGRTENGSEGAK